jgi:hypothetical protein
MQVVDKKRLILAVSLAAATLALFLAVIAVGGALRAGLAPWPGVAVVVMAAAAFVLSGRQGWGSFLVAGLLAASGAVGLVYGLVATEFHAAVEFPPKGPIFGVILGLPVLGLGVAKGVATVATARAGRPGRC